VFGLVILAMIIGSQYILNWNKDLFCFVICGFIYGLAMPLIVSAYVYD